MRFQKILVAIDSSEFAAHAVRVASDLATAGRLLLGSTAEGVVRHAPCPVMVVPPVTAAGDAG